MSEYTPSYRIVYFGTVSLRPPGRILCCGPLCLDLKCHLSFRSNLLRNKTIHLYCPINKSACGHPSPIIPVLSTPLGHCFPGKTAGKFPSRMHRETDTLLLYVQPTHRQSASDIRRKIKAAFIHIVKKKSTSNFRVIRISFVTNGKIKRDEFLRLFNTANHYCTNVWVFPNYNTSIDSMEINIHTIYFVY